MNTLKKCAPNDFMFYQKRVLKVMGFWPPQTNSLGRFSYLICSAFHTIFVNVLLIILETTECCLTWNNFKDTILNVAVITLHLSSFVRVINWYGKRKEFNEIIKIVKRDSFNFQHFFIEEFDFAKTLFKFKLVKLDSYEGFKKQWSSTTVTEKFDISNILEEYRKYCTRKACLISWSFHITMCMSTVFVLSLRFFNALFSFPLLKYSTFTQKNILMRQLPYNMYFPADLSNSTFYFLAWMYQFYAILVTVFGFFAIDCLVIGIMIHTTYQIKVVQKALIFVADSSTKTQFNSEKNCQVKFVKCVNEIQQILKTVDLLEQLLNKPLLFQYFFLTAVLCTTVHVLIMAETFVEIIGLVVVLLTVMMEPFFFSLNCQSINNELEDLLKKLYEINWLEREVRFKKMLIFTMMRLQKPSVLTMGKFTKINLAFFVNIMKMTYSFYALLVQTQKNK